MTDPASPIRQLIWPKGVVVYIHSATGPLPEVIPAGAYYTLKDDELKVFSNIGQVLRIFNWRYVVVMAGIETVGAANANN